MYDFSAIAALTAQAKKEGSRPSIIILDSLIGKGAPTKQGSAETHGAPLGPEEIRAAKEAMGVSGDFYVAPEAAAYFKAKGEEWKKIRRAWQAEFDGWSGEHPDKRREWDLFHEGKAVPGDPPVFAPGDKVATRNAGNKALLAAARANPFLTGGSADLKGPNGAGLPPEAGTYSRGDRTGRYIHFGIREFGMAAIANGIQLHGGLRAYCSTFMAFCDYLRPAMRLAALMGLPLIYVLTHDSIFVGEDGPTHQPVEQLTSLRIIPNMRVLRPGDAEETVQAWAMAMERHEGPVVLALSRQNLTVYAKADPDWKETIRTGAYIVKKAAEPEAVLIATGSEVNLALEAAALAEQQGRKVQVVSMISRELFSSQPAAIRDAVLPPGVRRICCEAGVRTGWERWVAAEDIFSVDRFGESAPAQKVAEHLGFTAAALAKLILREAG
jgi:transketolase